MDLCASVECHTPGTHERTIPYAPLRNQVRYWELPYLVCA